MDNTDKVLVVGLKDKDSVLMHIPKHLKTELEIVFSESSNIPDGCAIVMPRDKLREIDNTDFSQLQPLTQISMAFHIPEIPKLTPELEGYFYELTRQENQKKRETMKNISRYHSQLSKKGFKR